MREIKFRAWVFRTDASRKEINEMRYERPADLFEWQDNGVLMELMQYTGLKDKNGVEIYEGDILLCKDDDGELRMRYDEAKDEYFADSRHVVKWGGSYPAFDLDPNPNEEWNFLAYLTGGGGWVEVIGNIYENPNLLEAK